MSFTFRTLDQIVNSYPGLGTTQIRKDYCCPHCGAARNQVQFKGHRTIFSDYACKACGRGFNDLARKDTQVTVTLTLEQWVNSALQGDYQFALQYVLMMAPGLPHNGITDAIAQIGMYSSDPTRARESMVWTVQSQLRQHSQAQLRDRYISTQQREVEQTFQRLCAEADEYFHGNERREALQEAQERAQRVSDEQMQKSARMFAEAMADVMAERAK